MTFTTPLEGATISQAKDNHNGLYKASLSGVTAGVAEISVNVNDHHFAVTPVSVTLTPKVGEAGQGVTGWSQTMRRPMADRQIR